MASLVFKVAQRFLLKRTMLCSTTVSGISSKSLHVKQGKLRSVMFKNNNRKIICHIKQPCNADLVMTKNTNDR
ncbi:hypothetical protein FocTR4_00008659 [Fusarium oxysporum f. sp. cubense]|uniref:Uncharacterized protein n=1 Tax=Fusarium oxysporum f. sp. cubense TaxID=61366 RepID=A0A5C6SS72_FUSOC|nr:hypothetical protein FocTR4_00008659 [Fusarium oxysporum f. sp. cubense]